MPCDITQETRQYLLRRSTQAEISDNQFFFSFVRWNLPIKSVFRVQNQLNSILALLGYSLNRGPIALA